MLDDLRARFGAPFMETARARVARVRRHAGDSDLASVARELHALAGEAALLRFDACARLAREGLELARSGAGRKCKEAVDALESAVDVLGK